MMSLILWGSFIMFVLALIAFDLYVLHPKDRESSLKGALINSAFYIALAILFCAGIFVFEGRKPALEFATGYLIEKSLSVDNIFVFSVIFRHFAVPKSLHHFVLSWGILGALIMRGVMISTGLALLAHFQWLIFPLAGVLIWSGARMLSIGETSLDIARNPFIQWLHAHFRVSTGFQGRKFFVWIQNRLWLTPLLAVLITIEAMDLVFAVDSIPAIFAVTQDPFIVYTSNVFAILGLRALYIAFAEILPKFHYLSYALAIVLPLIGIKMIINGLMGEIIPVEITLLVTVMLIGGSIVMSYFRHWA